MCLGLKTHEFVNLGNVLAFDVRSGMRSGRMRRMRWFVQMFVLNMKQAHQTCLSSLLLDSTFEQQTNKWI